MAAVFLLLFRPWYSEYGIFGTFQVKTKWQHPGSLRGNFLFKWVTFAVLCAAVITTSLFIGDDDSSPLPGYSVEQVFLYTDSYYRLFDQDLTENFRFSYYLDDYDRLPRLGTHMSDKLNSRSLAALPLVETDEGWQERPYEWERFNGTSSDYGEYTAYVSSSAITIALRPKEYFNRRPQVTGTISWPLLAGLKLISLGDDEAELQSRLKAHPEVQNGLKEYRHESVRLLGWADLSFGASGPILLVEGRSGELFAAAILANCQTLNAECEASRQWPWHLSRCLR